MCYESGELCLANFWNLIFPSNRYHLDLETQNDDRHAYNHKQPPFTKTLTTTLKQLQIIVPYDFSLTYNLM